MSIFPGEKTFSAEIERADPLRIQVAKKLRQMLRLGRIPPGTRLTEKAVADTLGVSRTPAREALGVLAESGVLDALEQGGYIVPQLTNRDIDEMYAMRELLEVPALKASINAGNPALGPKLAACVQSLTSSIDDFESVAFLEHVLEFREILFHNCGNELLYRMILQLDNHTESLKVSVISAPEVRRGIVEIYGKIVDAVAKGDVKAAVALLRAHHADGRAAYHAKIPAKEAHL